MDPLGTGQIPNVGFGWGREWWGLAHPVIFVHFSRGPVKLADIQPLADFPSLVSLQINGASLGHAELAAIARLPALESLDLSGCQIPDDGLKRLVPLRKLKVLELQNTGVPESAVIELQEALPGLEVLDD